jgi:hypothetical protein
MMICAHHSQGVPLGRFLGIGLLRKLPQALTQELGGETRTSQLGPSKKARIKDCQKQGLEVDVLRRLTFAPALSPRA